MGHGLFVALIHSDYCVILCHIIRISDLISVLLRIIVRIMRAMRGEAMEVVLWIKVLWWGAAVVYASFHY